MAYTFRSQATADMIMLDTIAQHMLELMGKTPGEPGIVTVEQIPEVLRQLEAAVQADEEHRKQLELPEDEAGQHGSAHASLEHKSLDPISLRQRVAPLADMLRRSAAAGEDVTWTPAAH